MQSKRVVLAAGALAKDVYLNLDGSEETPPDTTTAKGSGTLSAGDDHVVTGSVNTSGIEGTAAHLHVGAPGVNGPPIITLERTATPGACRRVPSSRVTSSRVPRLAA